MYSGLFPLNEKLTRYIQFPSNYRMILSNHLGLFKNGHYWESIRSCGTNKTCMGIYPGIYKESCRDITIMWSYVKKPRSTSGVLEIWESCEDPGGTQRGST